MHRWLIPITRTTTCWVPTIASLVILHGIAGLLIGHQPTLVCSGQNSVMTRIRVDRLTATVIEPSGDENGWIRAKGRHTQ
jgi:hypothetical protein